MPNIASVLKDEIGRLARREVRRETGSLQKASAQYRRDIAALKRQVRQLERQVSLLDKQVLGAPPEPPSADEGKDVRFTAKGLRSHRKRLGFSAADYAVLVGVAPQSIYNWEQETAKPRKEQVLRLAAIRGMGKREATARLEQMAESAGGTKA